MAVETDQEFSFGRTEGGIRVSGPTIYFKGLESIHGRRESGIRVAGIKARNTGRGGSKELEGRYTREAIIKVRGTETRSM
jgi:hypothetical protein